MARASRSRTSPTEQKYNNRHFEVKLQWLGRHLRLPVVLAARGPRAFTGAWKLIRSIGEGFAKGFVVTLSHTKHTFEYANGRLKVSPLVAVKRPDTMQTIICTSMNHSPS